MEIVAKTDDPRSILLTERGRSFDVPPYITGQPISPEHGVFIGKQAVVDELVSNVERYGVAVLEGGFRSGRTSLLFKAADTLVKTGRAEGLVYFDLASYRRSELSELTSVFQRGINDLPGAVVLIDEMEDLSYYNTGTCIGFLHFLDEQLQQRNKVIFAVLGNLHSNSALETPPVVKGRIASMASHYSVVNTLLAEEEVRELLCQGGESFFTEQLLKYLVAEAGGHPLLASQLGTQAFLEINSITRVAQMKRVLKEKISGELNYFLPNVKVAKAAGFNPLTWEWTGTGKKPNVEVYRNMLPRQSSVLFKNWLMENVS